MSSEQWHVTTRIELNFLEFANVVVAAAVNASMIKRVLLFDLMNSELILWPIFNRAK